MDFHMHDCSLAQITYITRMKRGCSSCCSVCVWMVVGFKMRSSMYVLPNFDDILRVCSSNY